MATYQVEYKAPNGRSNDKVECKEIHESKDGAWLVFSDEWGEVKRYKADIVLRVTRTEK